MTKKDLEIKQIFSLAYEHHRKGDIKLAESLYNKILKIYSQHFETNFLLGTLFLQKRDFTRAQELLNKALSTRPNHANTKHNLGYALMETGNHKQAKEILLDVIKIDPKHVDAHYNLSNIYKYFGEFKMAEKYLKKTLEIQPNNSAALNNLGNILKEMGKFDEAIKSYEKATKIQINHPNAYHNLGNTYKQLGNFEKASDYYFESMKFNPKNLETLFSAGELNNEILDSNQKNKINKFMRDKTLNEKDIAYGYFLLSRYEYKERNFEKEFEYLLKGHSHYFNFKKITFGKGVQYWLEDIPNVKELMVLGKTTQNNEKIKPIFIVGVPRCGSTLIEKVIASGSKKIPMGEETAIISFFVGEKVANKKSLTIDIDNIKKRVIERYEEKGLIQKESDYIFTDKSLDNFFFIGLIKEIFPKAKVIHCRRNLISSILSIVKNNLGDVVWAHDLEHIFKFFNIYIKKIDEFKKMYPDFIYEIQLENFVNNPEIESKKLMQFCELQWDKKCLEFYKRKDITSRTASNVQIRKAIYKEPKDKNLPYMPFLEKFGKKYPWFK